MKCTLLLVTILFFTFNFAYSQNNSDTIYSIVENMPQFPGGETAMLNFVAKNVRYPHKAFTNNITGTIYISFIVGADGKVRDIELLRGIGGGCDEEGLRVVGLFPDWTPGQKDGKAVSVQYNLPIRFSLNKEYTPAPVYQPNILASKKYYNKGLKSFNEKNYDDAIENFTNAINQDVTDVDSYYNRAASYKKAGKNTEACNDWQTAKRLGDTLAHQLLVKYCDVKVEFYNDTIRGGMVYTVPEQMPLFPGGGQIELIRFIERNINYPAEARAAHKNGISYASFEIDTTGAIIDPVITQGIGYGCDEETIRIIQKMPPWIPGKVNGQPVRVKYDLSLEYAK